MGPAGEGRRRFERGFVMFIFTRATEVDRHHQMAAIGASVEVAAIVERITGLPISVYLTRYALPINHLRWSCRVDSQAEMETVNGKLLADASYAEWVDTHSHLYESAPVDLLARVISASGMEQGPAAYYRVLTATAANGRLADAVAFGVEAQQFVADATKLRTAFLTGVYGEFGSVTWLTAADSMDGIDALSEMEMSNPDYHELVKKAGELFIAGSGSNTLIQKIN